ncbi:MAG: hypothetical protein AAF380_01125 [Bacteroidota bacterium]
MKSRHTATAPKQSAAEKCTGIHTMDDFKNANKGDLSAPQELEEKIRQEISKENNWQTHKQCMQK